MGKIKIPVNLEFENLDEKLKPKIIAQVTDI